MKIELGKMKKYIAVFCAVLTMFVFAFDSVPVLASTDDDDSEFNSFTYLFGYTSTSTSGGQYHYRYNYFALTTRPADLKCVVVRNGDIVNVLIMSLNPFDYVTDFAQRNVGPDGDVHSGVVSGNKAYSAIHVQKTGIDYYYIAQPCVGYDINVYGHISGVLDYTGVENIEANTDCQVILNGGTPEHYTPRTPELGEDFDESTATYDQELGYLKNVKGYGLYKNDADEINSNFLPTVDDGTLKFVWDSTSTTGVDLSDENIFVRFYTSAGAIGSATLSHNDQLITDSKRNYYKTYPAGDCAITMTIDDFFSASDADYTAWYNEQSLWDIGTKVIVRRDTAYLQLAEQHADGSWTYGGFVKISFGRDKTEIDTISIFPNGEEDESSPTSGKLPFYSGSGDTDDEALADAQEKEENVDGSFWSNWSDLGDVLSSFVEGLSNLQQSLSHFPAVFAEMFSFLPREFLVVIGLGLSMAVVLRLLGR